MGKFVCIFFCCLGLLCISNGCSIDQSQASEEVITTVYDSTKIGYMSIGMGSNFGSLQPVFKSVGTNYTYKRAQTSFIGEKFKPDEPICSGSLRPSSIDSIINLVKDIQDTSIWKNNSHIMSGGIVEMWVHHDSINLNFTLWNAYDSIAQEIVKILNTNLPDSVNKLWISDFEPNLISRD